MSQELGGTPQTLQLGEIPTVQDRFQAVLKHRLQIQSPNHPPLFPWETQLIDYPDFVDEPSNDARSYLGMDGTTIEAETAVPLTGESFPAIAGTVSSVSDIFSPSRGKISSSGGELFSQRFSSTQRFSWIGAKKHLSALSSTLETMPNIQSDYSDLQRVNRWLCRYWQLNNCWKI